MNKVVIYTDGACSGNPGPGGYCAILTYGEHEKMISGNSPKTTNNHMELKAVVEALKSLKKPCYVEVVTDSKYVADAFNKFWVFNWEKQNNFAARPNAELWREIMPLIRTHKVTFTWIKGHEGHPYNERCDKEAVKMSRLASKTANKPEEKVIDYPWIYDGPLY